MQALRCPAHLVLAELDHMTPARAARNLAGALKATVHRVSFGDFMAQERPDEVLAALRKARA